MDNLQQNPTFFKFFHSFIVEVHVYSQEDQYFALQLGGCQLPFGIKHDMFRIEHLKFDTVGARGDSRMHHRVSYISSIWVTR